MTKIISAILILFVAISLSSSVAAQRLWVFEYRPQQFCFLPQQSNIYTIYEMDDALQYQSPVYTGFLEVNSRYCFTARQRVPYYAETYLQLGGKSVVVRSHIIRFNQVFLPRINK